MVYAFRSSAWWGPFQLPGSQLHVLLRWWLYRSILSCSSKTEVPNKRFNPTYAADGFARLLSRCSRGIRGLTWALGSVVTLAIVSFATSVIWASPLLARGWPPTHVCGGSALYNVRCISFKPLHREYSTDLGEDRSHLLKGRSIINSGMLLLAGAMSCGVYYVGCGLITLRVSRSRA
jgi:hypothetical protein